MRKLHLFVAALALTLLGCRTSFTPFPSAEVPGLAPIPFTAEAIRDQHASGATIEMEVVRDGAVVERTRTEFLDADTLSVTVRSQRFDTAGEPLGEPMEQRSTWEQLRAHAQFPSAATELHHARVRVPAGNYECWAYRVHVGDEAGTVRAFYFAVERPGPPVLMIEERGGVEVARWQMSIDARG